MRPGPDDDPDPRPWILLVLAAVLVWAGVATAGDPDLVWESFGAFGMAVFCVALFFLPDLRELVTRWRYW
jgi:hypothetical protein